MASVIKTITKRYSVRTYDGLPIEKNKLQQLTEFLESNIQGPFGSNVRFQIIDATGADKDELKQYGTYGSIKGPCIFIAGAVRQGTHAMEDFGYCMETVILKATELGLGTVWLGGFLNRSTFAARMNVSKDEVVPAVTPIGYPAARRSMADRFIRTLSSGDKRMDFGELFFTGNYGTALDKANSGKYFEALEGVRKAPSASNKQPWRIVKEKERNNFHFYLKEDRVYNSKIKGIKFQNIDMGIAMCHFELVSRELGFKGSWKTEKPGLKTDDAVYIASWIEDEL